METGQSPHRTPFLTIATIIVDVAGGRSLHGAGLAILRDLGDAAIRGATRGAAWTSTLVAPRQAAYLALVGKVAGDAADDVAHVWWHIINIVIIIIIITSIIIVIIVTAFVIIIIIGHPRLRVCNVRAKL